MKKILLKPQFILILVVVFWGSTFIVTKYVLEQHVPPIFYAMARYILGTMVMFVFYPFIQREESHPKFLFSGILRQSILLGFLQALGLILQVFGQLYTTASKSSFLTAFSIPLVPILAYVFYREKLHKIQWMAIALGGLGLGFLTYPEQSFEFNRGDLLTLACALVYAVAIVKTAHFSSPQNAFRLATGQTFFAMVHLVVFWGVAYFLPSSMNPLYGLEHRTWHISPLLIVSWVYMSTICIAVTFSLQLWAMSHMKATQAAVIFALEPLFATVMAMGIFGASEVPKIRGFIGAGLILLAVLLSELRPSHPESSSITQPAIT